MPELRPYQVDAIDSIMKAWDHCSKILLQMPTGLGKTTVFSEIIKDFIFNRFPNKRVLVLVHRIELLEQIQERLLQFGIRGTSITSSKDFDDNYQVTVATIQTLRNRLDIVSNFSLIVVDEAHHSISPSYIKVLDHYTSGSLKILGVTATPQRLDGIGFDLNYDVLIPMGQIRDYIPKYLCDVTQRASSYPEFKTIKIDPITKDYESESARTAMSESKVMANLVTSFKEYCIGKRTLIFAVNTAHSIDIVARLQREGIRVQHIDYKTKLSVRRQIVENFKEGKIDALCNVEIFTEGFDCPEIDVVIMARPTKSLVLYLQQAGRCLRPKNDSRKGLILDHAKLWLEHGLIKANRYWSLAGIKSNQETNQLREHVRKMIHSSEIEIPLEIKNLVMEEFQLEEPNDKRLPFDEKIEINFDWWDSLSQELKDILINSAQISIEKEEKISDSDLQAIWNMDTIDLQNTAIASTLHPLKRLQKIKRAECCMLDYYTINTFNEWKKLEYLDLSFSTITRLNPISDLVNLRHLDISNTQIESIYPIRDYYQLTSLNLSFSNIKQIGLVERFPNLERLLLSGLKIDNLNFLRNLSKLEYLNISHTDVSELNFLNNGHSLKKLVIHDCKRLEFSGVDLTRIEDLDCSFSNFERLGNLTNKSRNVHLERLNISGCKVVDMDELFYFDQLKDLIADDIPMKADLIKKLLTKNIHLTLYRNGERITYLNFILKHRRRNK